MPDIIVQLSDPHMTVGSGDTASAHALEATVERVLKLDPLPVAMLLTGDLAQHGRTAEYECVREIVERLQIPVHPIPGNHDDRDALRGVFSEHPQLADTGAQINYSILIGGTRVLMCDTLIPGSEAGRLHDATIQWVQTELEADSEVPTVIAMHHPPIHTGMVAMDAIGLPDDDIVALGELLQRAPNVRGVLTGHVHRAIIGELGGCRVTTCPSTFIQLELDLGPSKPFMPADEPPGFAIHVSDNGTVTSHIKFLGDHKPDHVVPALGASFEQD